MSKTIHTKDDAFYAEADEMADGWGDTLRYIDTLKDKIENNKDITLSEYCSSLYGDGYCSHCYLAFELHVKRDLGYGDKQMIHGCWEGLFKPWVKDVYDMSKFYEDP